MGHNIKGRTAVKIADNIEAGIAKGGLQPGERLPSVRDLAAKLGVNRNTVSAAYKRLATTGVLVADGRRGTRVATAPPVAASAGPVPLRSDVRTLEVGGPDSDLLPDLGSILSNRDLPVRNYGEGTNLPALLDVGREYFAADGFERGSLAVGAGALDSLERVLRIHLRPGDAVGLEDPGFLAGVALIRSLGFQPVAIVIDEEGMKPDELERALRQRVRAVILTPRAQNPTGAFMTKRRANALRRVLAKAPHVLVVEDDHAGPIAGAPAVSAAYGHSGPWAILRSVGKFLGPDLRLAFVLGDSATIARLEGHLALGMRWVSHLIQHTVVALWRSRDVHKDIRKAGKIYEQRRRALLQALEARGIPALGRSGLNVWVPVTHEVDTVQKLQAAGWAVAAGEGFRLKSDPGVRITVSTLLPDEAKRLADDLARVLAPSTIASRV